MPLPKMCIRDRLVLEHPLTVADLGDGARTAPGERELLAGAQLVHHP